MPAWWREYWLWANWIWIREPAPLISGYTILLLCLASHNLSCFLCKKSNTYFWELNMNMNEVTNAKHLVPGWSLLPSLEICCCNFCPSFHLGRTDKTRHSSNDSCLMIKPLNSAIFNISGKNKVKNKQNMQWLICMERLDLIIIG